MFDKPEHPEIASEKRQLGQANTQHLQALAAEDDQTFIHQKEEREDLVRWQQDVSDELFGLRHALKRHTQKEDGTWRKQLIFTGKYDTTGKPLYKELPPLLNENGIAMVETQIRPLISRNIIMSNFTEKRILSFLKRTMDVIVDNLSDNFDVYELKFHDMDTVVSLTLNYIMPSPYRAMNNGERKHLTTVTKRVETMSEHGQQPQEKKKLLGIF